MYKAKFSFTSNTGKYYHGGQVISSVQYSSLPHHEQSNFSKLEEDEPSTYSTISTPYIDYTSDVSTDSSIFGNDNYDVSSSDNSFDFGGGDSGGAGSSGDW